jgi:hypothetical protein
VVAALVLSSIVSLVWIAGGVGLLVSLVVAGGGAGPAMPIAVSVLVLLVAALGQLIFHLAKSFEAIKHPPFGQEDRGFEPLLVPPATPVVIGPPIVPAAPPQAGPDPADGRDTTYDPAARR